MGLIRFDRIAPVLFIAALAVGCSSSPPAPSKAAPSPPPIGERMGTWTCKEPGKPPLLMAVREDARVESIMVIQRRGYNPQFCNYRINPDQLKP